MKFRLRREAKIGIFGVAMLILLFWGINFLKGKDIFTLSNTYYTTFSEVEGMKVSSDVMLKGMKVGSITDIIYDPSVSDKIIVEFTIRSKYKIPDNSTMTTYSAYVIGGKVLVLDYGNSATSYKDRDTIPSVIKPGLVDIATQEFENIKNKAGELVDNINLTLASVNNLLSERNVDNIGGTLSGLNYIVNKDLKGITANLNTVTHTLSENADNINNIISNVNTFSDSLKSIDLPQLINNVNATIAELNATIAKVNNGDGTAAKLLNDAALYEDLVSASRNLSLLLEDLKANPKRYINISVFGGGNREKKNK